jgi:hypothetical protein
MRWRLVLLSLLVALGLAARPVGGQEPGLPLIKAADVHRWLVKGAPVALVDVRTREEYQARPIKGAVSVPLNEIPARASEIPRQGLVVLY